MVGVESGKVFFWKVMFSGHWLCQSTWGSPVPLDTQGFPQQHSIPGEQLFPCALTHPGVPGGDTMQEAGGVPLSSGPWGPVIVNPLTLCHRIQWGTGSATCPGSEAKPSSRTEGNAVLAELVSPGHTVGVTPRQAVRLPQPQGTKWMSSERSTL